jgi:SRSO17 transposase
MFTQLTAVSAHEKCFLLSKEVQEQSFCKACNMKESPWNYSKKIPWQHGSIKEHTDKWKMFVSQSPHWTRVK